MKPLPLDLVDLARSLPGGQRPQHSTRALLRQAASYIQFLQRRIRDTQDTLVPHSSQLGFWPLWTPRRSLLCTEKAGKCPPEPRKRIQLKVCAERAPPPLPPDSERRVGQKLVPYVSSSSSENGDTGPWLVSVMVSSPPPLSPGTPQSSVPPFLGLSPSLRSSPVDDVTVGGLVPPVLFEEVQICCSSPVQESATPSLDHSYQIQDDLSAGNSKPQQNGSGREEKQPETGVDPERKRRRPGSVTKPRPRSKARAKKVKPPTSSPPPSAQTSGKTAGPSRLQPIRKKCVNGFIMFCRLNRKAYLRVNPGKASTTATSDLAELWRNMSMKERRPYCMKALHYSVINDRLVKQRSVNLLSSGEVSPPKPLSVLLAEKSLPPTPVSRFFYQDIQ